MIPYGNQKRVIHRVLTGHTKKKQGGSHVKYTLFYRQYQAKYT